MKSITFSPSFQKKLAYLSKKDSKLTQKIKKKLILFRENPYHPSLRLHKLQGKLKDVWSISITMDFRQVFIEDEAYYFFDLGTHDQVYR